MTPRTSLYLARKGVLLRRTQQGVVQLHPQQLGTTKTMAGRELRRGFNTSEEPEVFLDRRGRHGAVAVFTLNRPEALNALNRTMMAQIHSSLLALGHGRGQGHPSGATQSDPAPRLVVLRGAGGRAFCAGGDVKAIAEGSSCHLEKMLAVGTTQGELLDPGRPGTPRSDFFREEYHLDYALAGLGSRGQTLLSLWDGLVMGGGVGISINGAFRVATEKTVFAMPETAIGIFPDVGSAYALSRLPRGLGQYIGLTGVRLRAPDLIHCGLATHFVPRGRLAALEEELVKSDGRDIHKILARFSEDCCPGESALAKWSEDIKEAFHDRPSVGSIIETLQIFAGQGQGQGQGGVNREWRVEQATNALQSLRRASPTSLKVTHLHIGRASTMNLWECYQADFRLMQHLMGRSDFGEGVRALLLDKDNKPVWKPSAMDDISAAELESLFSSLGEYELGDPLPFLTK